MKDSPEKISPLRRRMIEDMRMRKLSTKTQDQYIRAVRHFAGYLGRSPDTATDEDLRRYQLHCVDRGVSPMALNAMITGLRFFFDVTLKRPELMSKMSHIRVARRLPVVLSREEASRLIESARTLKHRTALSVAYGAGLRVSEVIALKVSDVDSERMLLRVEKGKGGRYRNAMLPADLLTLLREWWKVGHQQGVMHRDGWLFPGQHAMKPISTRQLHRIVVDAAQAAEITKRVGPHTLRHSFATHLLEDGVDIRVIQVLLGHAKLENTAFYTKVATRTVRTVTSPLDKLGMFRAGEAEPTG